MAIELKVDPFSAVVRDFKAGKLVIIADDAERENEGDLAVATEKVTAEQIGFMIREARGLICVSISSERSEALNLPLQAVNNASRFGTPFTVSIDHKDVAAAGITARARAYTMRALLRRRTRAEDLISPGHVFPLVANPAGVIGRQGQTEGSFDLARIAGLKASGVICEILNADGTMARAPELNAFAAKFGIKVTTIAEIITYRVQSEILVRETAQSRLMTDYGEFDVHVFEDDVEGKEHLALLYGTGGMDDRIPLVRLHSECLTGDVFGSQRCDCGPQLARAAKTIVSEGLGMILYLRQEGRGIGLGNKLRAYELQDRGHDTVEANIQLGFPADLRDYAAAAKMLESLNIKRVRLLTNNPRKCEHLARFGIEVLERVPLIVEPTEHSRAYLETKRTKLGHLL